MVNPVVTERKVTMIRCTTGQLQEHKKGGELYYRIRLNLVDDNAQTRKEKYKNKYIPTNLLVGGRTGRIKNKTLAEEMLAQAIREYTPVGASMQFDKYVAYWMSELEKGYDQEVTTKKSYANRAKYIISYFEKQNLTLQQVDVGNIRDFSNYLHETTSSKGKPLSEEYIRDILKETKQIFKFAQENGHLFGKSPFATFKMPKVHKKYDDMPYITEEQVDEFLKLVRETCADNYILQAAFTICLFYGLRREELCGLRWSALRNDKMYIEHTVTRVDKLVYKDRAKTDRSNRSCDIYPEVKSIFDKVKEKQKENRLLFGEEYHDSDYVFTWEDGRPFAPDYYSHKFKDIIRKSNTLDQRLHLHNLRATCVSLLAHRGMSITDIAAWIGDSVKTTQKYYLRTSSKHKYETGKAMAEILF